MSPDPSITGSKTDPVEYVSSLKIVDSVFPIDTLKETAFEESLSDKPQAFINNRSVVSFASSVSGQNREDTLHSVLLAQLAATKQFRADEELMDWYKKYCEVLNQIGWTSDQQEFTEYNDSKGIFEMENVILDILATAIGGRYLAIVVKTLEAFKKLSDTDNRILAFERNTHSLSKGAFQIAFADETNGLVSITCAAFALSSQENIRKILFFKSGRKNVSLQVSTVQYSLNSSVYAQVRSRVLSKLGSQALKTVAELEI